MADIGGRRALWFFVYRHPPSSILFKKIIAPEKSGLIL
jgi:hypothetical protein